LFKTRLLRFLEMRVHVDDACSTGHFIQAPRTKALFFPFNKALRSVRNNHVATKFACIKHAVCQLDLLKRTISDDHLLGDICNFHIWCYGLRTWQPSVRIEGVRETSLMTCCVVCREKCTHDSAARSMVTIQSNETYICGSHATTTCFPPSSRRENDGCQKYGRLHPATPLRRGAYRVFGKTTKTILLASRSTTQQVRIYFLDANLSLSVVPFNTCWKHEILLGSFLPAPALILVVDAVRNDWLCWLQDAPTKKQPARAYGPACWRRQRCSRQLAKKAALVGGASFHGIWITSNCVAAWLMNSWNRVLSWRRPCVNESLIDVKQSSGWLQAEGRRRLWIATLSFGLWRFRQLN
jgi:hypothetical protein